MADTIIERSAPSAQDAGAGWAVAVAVLLAVIVLGGLFLFARRGAVPATPNNTPDTDINVTVPNPINSGGSGNTPDYGTQ
ncbi:hypothetical protein A3D71_02115 [Candidatus Kaiserbacteria bacterium RIFCSPHIGHO2_02_FULL_55_20]|uniref:Uncharacterized protein n=1 Tax=Candidatus Kaiserbacteria bacterium RIFCSPHIGHO2_02_FULL_55_20 TaxID=1798497 RepID=A0A1F6DYB5_9BACT|nr:MAG: hypothetical protein A2680_02975 [Candidatus Kaiserbacteria bacterium RIFCSPHIGHO2_01_FULL_55_37]OGG65992.1 MAG: hypothetical protein A3D71_02115 [Candidatus Kaiserbacteria bacterium RIFCSPHIGHO2_02_FULL_55_20]